MKMAVRKTPPKALVDDLYRTTYESEKELGKDDETAERIAKKVTAGAKKAWIYFAKHPIAADQN